LALSNGQRVWLLPQRLSVFDPNALAKAA